MPQAPSPTDANSKPQSCNEVIIELPLKAIGKNQHCEADVIEGLVFDLKKRGYKIREPWKLKFGVIDLVAWSDRQTVLFEVKFSEDYIAINDIIHGLGQLLCYRSQIHNEKQRPIKCVIYATGEMDYKTYKFLRDLCADFDVILHAPLVDLVKYL